MMFENIKKVHFVGIGGIGVSALARMMLLLGKKVTGSDLALGEAALKIKKQGAKVLVGHKKKHVDKNVDLVVYSPAVPNDNPEIIRAKKLNISIYSYPQTLGLISKEKYTIAVSGTHGKTTTTAMVADILIAAKKDPMVVVGSFLKKQHDNFIMGQSKYFVVEACEYRESFLNLNPDILVITNIDADHLDYFKTFANVKKAFAKFACRVPSTGFIIANLSDKNVADTLIKAKPKAEIIDYSKQLNTIKLKVIGRHNQSNAQAAIAVASVLNIDKKTAASALRKFSGTWRRFEYKGKTKKGALVYDDYAHHPTEIAATLTAAKQAFPDKKIIVVFQPHLYSRTKQLLSKFSKALLFADEALVLDIYAAREKKNKTIHSRDLVKKIGNKAKYAASFAQAVKLLRACDKESVIITMGAGDVYLIGDKIVVW